MDPLHPLWALMEHAPSNFSGYRQLIGCRHVRLGGRVAPLGYLENVRKPGIHVWEGTTQVLERLESDGRTPRIGVTRSTPILRL